MKSSNNDLERLTNQMNELDALICKQQQLVARYSKIFGNDFAYADHAERTIKKWNYLNKKRNQLLIKK